MSVKNKNIVLKQMEEILGEYNKLKETFEPIGIGYSNVSQFLNELIRNEIKRILQEHK